MSTPAGIEHNPYQRELELPPSSPKDMLTKIYYPPDSALPEILPDTKEILFSFKNKKYGRFQLVSTDPISFRVIHSCLIPPSVSFLNECYDDPNKRPESTKTSEDLSAASHLFPETLYETLGFTLNQFPPAFNMHKKHPLHNEIRVALNKHRELRTPKQELLKIVCEVETRTTHKRLLGMKNRPLPPKVQDFMTETASENVDEVVSFLNTGTACNFNYVSDLSTAFAYFSIPQAKFLAVQHQLKEEVLFYLGLYNFVASTHTAISKAKEKSTDNSCAGDLEAIKRWNAYGYKSVAKMAKKAAEKLGAACLILRFEAIAQQEAPELADILVYTQDVVSPYILTLRGQTFFDTAVANKTFKLSNEVQKTEIRRPTEGDTTMLGITNPKDKLQAYNINQETNPFAIPITQEAIEEEVTGYQQVEATKLPTEATKPPIKATKPLTKAKIPRTERITQTNNQQIPEVFSKVRQINPDKTKSKNDSPGARLLEFPHAWKHAPPSIQKLIQKGFHWTWIKNPPTLRKPTLQTPSESTDFSQAVTNLLEKKAIYQVPNQPCFLSNIFLVPKQTGGMRFIINLKKN